MTDDHNCRFGKWYFSEGEKAFGLLSIFKRIGEQHAKVHAMARDVARLCKNGEKQQALALFKQFGEITGGLFELLDQLEHEVNREEPAVVYHPRRGALRVRSDP